MRKTIILLFITALCFTVFASEAQATTSSIILRANKTEMMDDTHSRDSNPSYVYGAEPVAYIGGNAGDAVKEYQKWNLLNLTNLGITSAKILDVELFMSINNNGTGTFNISANQVYNDNWSESSTSAALPCGLGWTVNSLYCNLTATDRKESVSGAVNDFTLNLTNLVKVSLDASRKNFSIMIMLNDTPTGSFLYRLFNSKENTNITLTPYLNVTYDSTGGGGGVSDMGVSASGIAGWALTDAIDSYIIGANVTTDFVWQNSSMINNNLQTIVLFPDQSATVVPNSPNSAWGTQPTVNIDTVSNARTIYRWSDFSLLRNKQVIAAEVDLFHTGGSGSGACAPQLQGVETKQWTEGTLTWNNRPQETIWLGFPSKEDMVNGAIYFGGNIPCTDPANMWKWILGGYNVSGMGIATFNGGGFDYIKNGINNNLLDIEAMPQYGSGGFSADGLTETLSSRSYTANTSARPRLILTVRSNTTTDWTITRVGAPDNPVIDQTPSTSNTQVAVYYHGTTVQQARIGFSIGRGSTGYCDSACYGTSTTGPYTASDGTIWYAGGTFYPGQTSTFYLPFTFRSSVFQAGQSYDVIATIRPLTSFDQYDRVVVSNSVTPVAGSTTNPVSNGTEPVGANSVEFVISHVNGNASSNYYAPMVCKITSHTQNATYTSYAQNSGIPYQYTGIEKCTFYNTIYPDTIDYEITAVGYNRVNATINLTTATTSIPVTLVPAGSTGSCTLMGSSPASDVCASWATVAPYTQVGASGWYCQYDPNSGWKFYACTLNYFPTGIANSTCYNQAGNSVSCTSTITQPGTVDQNGNYYAVDAKSFVSNLGAALGVNNPSIALAFLSAFVSLIVGGIVTIKSKSGPAGLVFFIGTLFMFAVGGWFPAWVFVLFIIIGGYILAKTIGNMGSGG